MLSLSRSCLRQLSLVLVSAAWFPINAQETRGEIVGLVSDSQNAVIPGASVIVRNVNTGVSVSLTTNETGYYEAGLLIPGNYEITINADGFKKVVRQGIHLALGDRLRVNLTLELGAVTESITVSEDASMLATTSTTAARVMTNREVMSLPVFNNSPVMLMKLTPGVVASSNRRYNGVNALGGLSDAGLPGGAGGTDWSVDGAPTTGNGYQAAYLPYTTTIQEYKIETANFDAAHGKSTGISVSIITKPGTNEVHGSVNWQYWNERWNAPRFFLKQQYYRNIALAESAGDTRRADALRSQPIQPPGHSNNYAGTVGGPVLKNKLFYFVTFDGFDDKKFVEGSFGRTIATPLNRTGDFRDLLAVDAVRYTIHDPLTIRPDPARAGNFVRTPFPNNVLPQSRIANPGYNTYRDFLPTPNNPPAAGFEPLENYQATNMPRDWHYKSYSNRMDYNTNRHRFYGRWTWSKYREQQEDWTYETRPGLHTTGVNRNYKAGIANWAWTVTPQTLVDATFSLSDFEEGNLFEVPFDYKPSDVGLPAYLDTKAGTNAVLPQMIMDGYQTIGQNVPAFTHYQLATGKLNVSHVRGRHTIRAGLDLREHYRLGGAPGNTSGNFRFTNDFTRRYDDTLQPAGNLGHTWAAFMMGLPTQVLIDTNDTFAMRSPYWGWYVQDKWRATSKLTLDFGLRIEWEGGRYERYSRVINDFDPTLASPITAAAEAAYRANPIPELPASAFRVIGGSTYPGVEGRGKTLQPGEWMWMPRFGAAYQLDSKTVVRGGYGRYFDTINTALFAPDQTGFSRQTSSIVTNNFGVNWALGDPVNGVSPLKDPFPVRPDGSRFDQPVGNALGSMALAGRNWSYTPYSTLRRARQHSWRVEIQRQLTQHLLVSLAYHGLYADRTRIDRRTDPLPEQFWADGLTRDNARANNLNANVPNPFFIGNFASLQQSHPLIYQSMATNAWFTSPTIRKHELLRPYPQMGNLTATNDAVGTARSDSLEATVQRRFASGYTFSFSYQGLKAVERDFYFNEFDSSPSEQPSNQAVPHRFIATGIFELPFGRGKRWLQGGAGAAVLGGWQIAQTYEWQAGALLDWGSNIFYYGDPADVAKGQQTLERWFNTDNFERTSARGPAAFHRRVFPNRINGVRADDLNQWNANIQRRFGITEKINFEFRFDLINAANHSQFNAPNLDPYSTNFGRITAHSSTTNRFVLIQGRILF